MGYTYENLPTGLQLIGQPWSEPILIEIAYAYEQADGVTRSEPWRMIDCVTVIFRHLGR